MRIPDTGSAFAKDERAVAGTEFVLIAPLLFLMLLGSASLFNAFRTHQLAEKATYALGDVISRQEVVDDAFLATARATFHYMVPFADSGEHTRISSITRKASGYVVDWSAPSSGLPVLTTATIPLEVIPDIAQGDSVILAETRVDYVFPASFAGFPNRSLVNISAVRPRFVSSIVRTP